MSGRARLLRVALAAVIAAAAVAPAATGTAPAASVSGLHNARYCEIIELRGSPPDATAKVWNTIGQNRCPAAWWNAFDAGALAKELGATFVVLNGPRYFLMDSATADTGGVRAFHGMRLTNVATIPIRTAADLVRTPYTDRTIARSNTWRWKRGRTVFELVAPGGDTYVMQSYAQIVDPGLTIGKLRGLGARLRLPPAGATGPGGCVTSSSCVRAAAPRSSRTTCRTPTSWRPPRGAPVAPTRHAVSLTGRTRTIIPPATPGTVEDHGTVKGTPFGRGSIVLVGTLTGGRLRGTFRLRFRRGSVTGSVETPFKIKGDRISFRGTSRLTGGTGAYRGIKSGPLRTRDTNTLDGQSGRLFVSGHARY